MKRSTLSAKQHLVDGLESLLEAQKAMKLSQELAPNWLKAEAIGRIKEASAALQIAGGHVVEVIESELVEYDDEQGGIIRRTWEA